MFPSTTRNIVRNADVDTRTPHIHTAIDRPLGPRFRGDDGDYYWIPTSMYKAAGGATRLFLWSLLRG